MIKTLSASKDKDYQISPHFKGWEMRSHCNGTLTTDFIKYNTYLFLCWIVRPDMNSFLYEFI